MLLLFTKKLHQFITSTSGLLALSHFEKISFIMNIICVAWVYERPGATGARATGARATGATAPTYFDKLNEFSP